MLPDSVPPATTTSQRSLASHLVLVIEHAQHRTREEAVASARQEVDQRAGRFQELDRQVPTMCEQLGLTDRERAAVDTYMQIMGAWMSGYHAWQTQTRRYTTAPHILPNTGPGYFDRLLPV
ncbi:hypothetical protein ACGFY6_09805 [Streptomyces sp. NPDC048387]|uniref:hypothetical protein n=1 Tax=Streptomyces sp. NPDC048387 TaxID=3365542 RepID=UPI00371E0F8A